MVDVHRVRPQEWATLREVRLAALRDAPSAFASTYASEVSLDERHWRSRLEQHAFFLAWAEDAPVGVAAGYPDARDPARWQLISVWVAPQVRGQGVGGRLIDAVSDFARFHDAVELALWVVEDNTHARRSYERAGFMATGERQRIRTDEPTLEQRMVISLDG